MVIFGNTIIKGDLAGLARSQHSALVCSDYSASQAGRRRVFQRFSRIRANTGMVLVVGYLKERIEAHTREKYGWPRCS